MPKYCCTVRLGRGQFRTLAQGPSDVTCGHASTIVHREQQSGLCSQHTPTSTVLKQCSCASTGQSSVHYCWHNAAGCSLTTATHASRRPDGSLGARVVTWLHSRATDGSCRSANGNIYTGSKNRLATNTLHIPHQCPHHCLGASSNSLWKHVHNMVTAMRIAVCARCNVQTKPLVYNSKPMCSCACTADGLYQVHLLGGQAQPIRVPLAGPLTPA